jgi:hypothetical protein
VRPNRGTAEAVLGNLTKENKMAYTLKGKVVTPVTITVEETAVLLDAHGKNAQPLGTRPIKVIGGTVKHQWDCDLVWCTVEGSKYFLVIDGVNAVIAPVPAEIDAEV